MRFEEWDEHIKYKYGRGEQDLREIHMKIAVITGASSGLGQEYVKELNRKETGIDEIWAIARREERLMELKELSQIPVRVLPYDLVEKSSIDALAGLMEKEKPDITLLINAAGFGKIGSSSGIGLETTDRMIDLNCRAAVDMTYICLPYMGAGSRIMEICSTAGFQPFQYLNVYAASKAFLYRFTRALRVELFPRRIKVTAVCPYWIRDTEFISVAERADGEKRIRHYPLSSRVHSVAVHSLLDSRLGLPVSTPGIMCTAHRIAAKVIPAELMMGIWAILRRL